MRPNNKLCNIVVTDRTNQSHNINEIYNHTTINIVRLSVTVGHRWKRRAARSWLGVLGVIDTRFGVSEPAADAER